MSFDRVGDHFYEDCRVFLSKFKTKESLRFDAFAEVWQEMKFSFILSQWKYLGEMQEIVEEYLKVCKRIWLKSEPVEERVCGLYLLRAIYLKQPASQYVKITLSHEDWQCMKHFLYVIKDFVQNETRYILQELFDLNAFTFSVPDCTPVEGKDDGGLSESVVTEFTKAHTFYNEMFLALQQENKEYKEQRKACLRVYPELRSFANGETDSLVEKLMGRLTVFEKEVSKVRHSLPGSNVAPGSSLRQDESATEETGRRKPTRRNRSTYRVTAVVDGCETEESSESEDETNLDMPYLHSEDSDEDEEDEESCGAPTVRSFHMSDFDLSSASSEGDEGAPRCSTATGSSKRGHAAASSEPEASGGPSPRPPSAQRGRRPRGRPAR